MPRIAAILIYPVEGCRGLRVKGCGLTARGLEGDRRWKLVGPRSEEATRTLARVWVEQKGSELWASAAGMDRLLISATAGDWFSQLLGTPVTCVAQEASGPLIATTTASLAALNQKIEKRVTVDTFHPNLVLEGTDPYAEETWASLKVGGAQCRVAPNPHTLRHAFGVQLTPVGEPMVQLRAGQSLDVALRERS